MNEKEYIDKLISIRNEINGLIDILWGCKENKDAFITKRNLTNQVYSDIRDGYEKE